VDLDRIHRQIGAFTDVASDAPMRPTHDMLHSPTSDATRLGTREPVRRMLDLPRLRTETGANMIGSLQYHA